MIEGLKVHWWYNGHRRYWCLRGDESRGKRIMESGAIDLEVVDGRS